MIPEPITVPDQAHWTVETNQFLCGAKGVIHLGANRGQECELYCALWLPAILVEALDEPFQALKATTAKYKNQRPLQYLLTDVDGEEYDFGIANNDAQSSSIFEFGDHMEIWPEVHYVDSVKLKSSTFKTMVEREGIDLASYDALIMDVQGAELLVLRGMGDLVDAFQWIRCETADFEVYKGCCQMKDLDAYLMPRGFNRVKTLQADGRPDLGYAYEALYEKTMEVN